MGYFRRRDVNTDFFDLLAVKPEQSDLSSPSEHSLRRIAESSLVERPSVRILCWNLLLGQNTLPGSSRKGCTFWQLPGASEYRALCYRGPVQ
jgi:hypothetical protein